ncbi:hypothetical protein LOTGIDRAFT_226808 [Lottia gigantea]|uniref:Glucosidase 2 subunit beta n=1 Tax=Lottia gigantea TaxID=225164 RepID=V4AQL3_LOTGI|nr:hypothetical protein LOTGIDRAFT_226808 [Lottia gigantea]ESO97115.1 hypothetical protein LOTGIDRAFT_226808 [Lottia gigantea]
MTEKAIILALCLLYYFVPDAHCGIDRPRGVPASKASYYKPGETFKCITDGKTIPFEYINDDYCDCDDGSDEPGTSACPMMMFYCENKGHKPEYILSSRYNDGICDCCDGSDEFGGEKIQCQNFCEEIGRKDREDRERLILLQTEGFKVKLSYIQLGQSLQQEKKARLTEIASEKDTYEKLKTDLEAKKNEAEAPEKEAKEKHEKAWEEEKEKKKAVKERETALMAFDEIDANDDQHVEIHEMLLHPEFDIDSDGTVSHDEAKEYLEELERAGQDEFLEKIWPNIKEIFKSKKFSDDVKEVETTESTTEQKEPEVKPQPKRDNWAKHEYGDDDDEDEEEDDEELEDEDYDATTPPPPVEEVPEDKMPDYDEETQKLIDAAEQARNEFNDADRKVKDTENEINTVRQYLDIDFGPEFEYGSLKGQCFEMTDREYTYKLCPFDKASQRPKNGGSETSLGNWGHWSGSEADKYSAMKYEKGQNCWSGPDRSVEVILQCGTENLLLSASEPSRCEYRFDFATPARCIDPATLQPSPKDTHDEL